MIIGGIHPVEALLTQQPKTICYLLINNQRHDARINKLIALAEKQGIPIKWVSKEELNHYDLVHQGVVAHCQDTSSSVALSETDIENFIQQKITPTLLLILDGIKDPHNLGACLRTAAAMGVDLVIIPKDRAASLNATVHKVASGGADKVPVIAVTNLARTLRQLKELGVWLYGTAANATLSLDELTLPTSIGWVLGAEDQGLRYHTEKLCDYIVSIPMPGAMESLNVSVACGICLYETVKQFNRR